MHSASCSARSPRAVRCAAEERRRCEIAGCALGPGRRVGMERIGVLEIVRYRASSSTIRSTYLAAGGIRASPPDVEAANVTLDGSVVEDLGE